MRSANSTVSEVVLLFQCCQLDAPTQLLTQLSWNKSPSRIVLLLFFFLSLSLLLKWTSNYDVGKIRIHLFPTEYRRDFSFKCFLFHFLVFSLPGSVFIALHCNRHFSVKRMLCSRVNWGRTDFVFTFLFPLPLDPNIKLPDRTAQMIRATDASEAS